MLNIFVFVDSPFRDFDHSAYRFKENKTFAKNCGPHLPKKYKNLVPHVYLQSVIILISFNLFCV